MRYGEYYENKWYIKLLALLCVLAVIKYLIITMKKLLLVLCLLFAFNVFASDVSDGAIVKTLSSPDVYIVKYSGGKMYKRLVLNPKVFESYQHLKWENVITISQSEMDSYKESDLVKVDGTNDIYLLSPNGDYGDKYLLTSTSGYDLNSVYIINSTDFNNYTYKGEKGALKSADTETTVKNIPEIINTSSTSSDENVRLEKASGVLSQLSEIVKNNNSQIEENNQHNANIHNQLNSLKNCNITSSGNIVSSTDVLYGQQAYEREMCQRENTKRTDELNSQIISESDNEKLQAINSKILIITYELNDYVNEGTSLSSADRAFLFTLGISW